MKFVKFCREMGILGATRAEPGILKLTDVDLVFVTSKPRVRRRQLFPECRFLLGSRGSSECQQALCSPSTRALLLLRARRS